MKRTAKTAIVGAAILMAIAESAIAQAPVLIGFDEGEAQLAVRRAVEGAGARLARLGCREVLSDFTDEAGQRLDTKLLASGRSPAQALELLRFFDDRTAPHCRAGTAWRSHNLALRSFEYAAGSSENGIAKRPRSSSFTSSCTCLVSGRTRRRATRLPSA